MAASDVAALCIFLEQCGFLTDPAPMVADLYAAVAARVTMTVSDAEIYSFAKLRHRQRICLQAAERLDAMPDQRAWRSAHSYRFECLTRGDQVAMLTVQGAKCRERPRIEITFPDCDMCYTKGDPES